MVSVIFGILSIMCLAYFAVIAVYSGIKTSAIWIWVVLAVFFFLLSQGASFYRQHKKQIPLWIPVSLITLCITGLAVFIILQTLIFGGMLKNAPDRLDYLIVLGAKVREDDISASLKRRLDKVIRYVEEHPDTKLVLSGGQGEGEPTTEAYAMAEYLCYNGVDPGQMFLEVYSTNTKENMICSKALIDDQQKKQKEREKNEQITKNQRRMEVDRFLMKTDALTAEQTGQNMSELFQNIGNIRRKNQTIWKTYGPGDNIDHLGMEGNFAGITTQILPGAVEILPDRPLQIGVLTSNFHLFRAMQIGKKYGFDHLYGVASTSDPVLFIHLCVRESIAILKDKFMGHM